MAVALTFLPFLRTQFLMKAANDEEASAKQAAADADPGAPTIFDKIIAKEIPSTIVYEDESVLAFKDINPQTPVHVVVIPKFRDGLTQLGKAEPRHQEILGHPLFAAKLLAEKGVVDGFRVVINTGPSGLSQSPTHSWWETNEMATWLKFSFRRSQCSFSCSLFQSHVFPPVGGI